MFFLKTVYILALNTAEAAAGLIFCFRKLIAYGATYTPHFLPSV